MIFKGINIENTTAALVPSSHYPPLPTDTLPSSWPCTNFPISSIRTYQYSQTDNPMRSWVLWAILNNIKVVIGISAFAFKEEIDSLAVDAQNPIYKSGFEKNVLAYSIGNETLLGNIDLVYAGIEYLRKNISESLIPTHPITSVLATTEEWILNTYPPENAIFTEAYISLSSVLDIVMFNTYGVYFNFDLSLLKPGLSWTSNGVQNSAILNQFGSLRFAMEKANINKPLWIGEVGWSSAPLIQNEPVGWSTVENLL